jgi:hypothetical protein
MCFALLLGLQSPCTQRSKAHSSQRQLGGVAKLSPNASSSLFFLLPSLFSRRSPYNTHTRFTLVVPTGREKTTMAHRRETTHKTRRSLSQLLLSLSILLLLAPHYLETGFSYPFFVFLQI